MYPFNDLSIKVTTPFIRVGSLSAINRSPDKIEKKILYAFGGCPLPQLLFCNQNCPDNSNYRYRTVLKIIGRGRHVASFLKVVVEVGGGGSKSRQSECKKKKKSNKKEKNIRTILQNPYIRGVGEKGVQYLNIWSLPIIFTLIVLKISNGSTSFTFFSFNLFFGWSRSPLPHTHTPYTHAV